MISVSDGLLDIVIFATLRLKQQTLPLLDCRKLDFYLKAKFSTFEKLLIISFLEFHQEIPMLLDQTLHAPQITLRYGH